MSAFADFENTSTWSGRKFEAPPQPGGSWAHTDDASCSTFDFNEDGAVPCCKYCFTNFSTYPEPEGGTFDGIDNYPQVVYNTSEIIQGCNCMGVFPVPFQFCLSEFEDLRKDTLFKCISTGSVFINNLRAFLVSADRGRVAIESTTEARLKLSTNDDTPHPPARACAHKAAESNADWWKDYGE